MLLTTFDPFAFGRTVRAGLPMDSVRRKDDVVFRFDLPGVSQDDIEVSVNRGVLSISAKRAEESKSETDRVLVRERVTGSLRRRIYLGDGYDADKIEAAFENGVLTVRVPVAEQAKARKVEISTDASKMIAA
jgi:HSP20 family protein